MRSQKAQRRKTIIGGAAFLFLTVATLVAVTQLGVIREFFGQASGIPANIYVDTQTVLGPVPRPWRNLAQGGEDFAWRIEPINSQVKDLNPEYIRLDHIYDFYEIVQGSPGNLTFDFTKLDVILDDITATGAIPFISLSYMPPAISSGDIISQPHRWEDWQLTVQKTIEHVSGTRGIDDVYYEVWNEPDLFGDYKYYGDKNYLTMYKYAALGAANAKGVRNYKIGGPAITALYKNWFNALAKFAIANNLRYDFFSWHRYNTDIDQFNKDIAEVNLWVKEFPQLEGNLEFHITEWGHDSENHSGYDDAFSAAHTVATAIAMNGRVSSGRVNKAFVFEIQDGKDPEGKAQWGRWGMIGHNDHGAKLKPRYHGLKMLDSIADQRLQLVGNGSWVKALAARNVQGNTELVIANYDSKSSHSENVPITFLNVDPGEYFLKSDFLSGRSQTVKVATTAAQLRVNVFMPANDVAKVELLRQ